VPFGDQAERFVSLWCR